MTDYKILHEAVRLVSEGICVTLPVEGRSMLPFIIGGRESVILTKAEHPKVGDIVLAWVEKRRFVVHRITEIKGTDVTLMGDGNSYGREYCCLEDIKALAQYVVDSKGVRHNLYTPWRKRASKIWNTLLPIRRYLLIARRMMGFPKAR